MSAPTTTGTGTAIVASAGVATVATLATAAGSAVGNGLVLYGFVGATDPGLAPTDYVVVPHGSARGMFDERANGDADADYATHYLECLYSDAATVARFTIPDNTRAFVAANRANSYAAGYLGDESVSAPSALDDAAKAKLITAYPHIAEAAAMDIQRGTLAIFVTSVCYYQTNHNIGGSKLPAGHAKAIRTALGVSVDDKALADAVYLAGHAADKRLTLRSMLPDAEARKLVEVPVYFPAYQAGADAWASLRIGKDMMPSGTAVLGLTKVVLNEVAKHGLLGFSPGPQAVAALKAGYDLVKADPGAYHPGAKYLFDQDVVDLATVEDLKGYLATFGSFCLGAGVSPSVTSVPHVAALIAERRSAVWYNIGKVVGKGLEVDDTEVIAASTAYGLTVGSSIPAPSADAAGYKAAVDALAAEFQAIKM